MRFSSGAIVALSLFCLGACGARDALLGEQSTDDGAGGAGASGGEGQGGEGASGGGVVANVTVVAGAYHTCAIGEDARSVSCWGRNDVGQLGNPGAPDSPAPLRVPFPDEGEISTLAAGFRHTCAVVGSQKVYCWGENGAGQVGITSASPVVDVATQVPLPDDAGGIASLAAGEYHTCAAANDGRIYCWGNNQDGQLGVDTPQIYPNPPLLVTDVGRAADLGAGDFHSCATNADGTYCWGSNFQGQLGNGTTMPGRAPTPVPLGDVVAIESKGFATLALQSSGVLYGWGENFTGVLGPGHLQEELLPVVVHEGIAFTAASVGLSHACGLLADGSLGCWGDNQYGELGDGTQTGRQDLSVTIDPSFIRFTEVAAGGLHTCGRADDGTIFCWGQNDDGRCGQPPAGPILSPIAVPGT